MDEDDEQTVPITCRISKEAHDILRREAERLTTDGRGRLKIGELVTEAILWAEDCEVWEDEIESEIKDKAQKRLEARRERDRERKRKA
jgi:hypothetical protein